MGCCKGFSREGKEGYYDCEEYWEGRGTFGRVSDDLHDGDDGRV